MSNQSHSSAVVTAAAALACAGMTAPCHGQCVSVWDTDIGNPGIGSGYAAPMRAWDAGGGERVYVGGSFSSVGGVGAAYAAAWDPATGGWSALGGGIRQGFTNAFITSFQPFDPGSGERLVVGGFYDSAAGIPETASLAMWDGTGWEAMGTGWTGSTRGSIWSMAEWNGRLYVGGGVVNQPPMIAGLPWAGVASWDGEQWQSHATSMSGFSPYVGAMAVFDDGSGEALYAVGRFNSINGVPGTALIARFDGEEWTSVGGGMTTTTTLHGMEGTVVYDDGSGPALYVAGYAFIPPGQPETNLAKWDGTQWTSVGTLIGPSRIAALEVFDDGTGPTFYVGGTGFALGALNFFARLVDGAWETVDGGVNNWVFGLSAIGDDLFVAGNFSAAGGEPASGLAIRTGCPSCYADCDESGGLDFFDFLCFQNAFAAMEPYADCDESGSHDFFDFLCFQNEFAAGCP